jgi:hypothetical protein
MGAGDWSRPIGVVDREILPKISFLGVTEVIKMLSTSVPKQ